MNESKRCWRYRLEGNQRLVIYNQVDKVVQIFQKRPKKRNVEKCDSHILTKFDILDKLRFVETVVKPIIGNCFVYTGKIVQHDKDYLRMVDDLVRGNRLTSRLVKEIDMDCPYVIEMPDLCFVPNCKVSNGKYDTSLSIAVEIKPKCGIIPNWKNYNVCKFCMSQHYKVQEGKWKSVSKYCPLDLYSGNRDRMLRALQSLFKTPQNNFRIFINGQVFFSEENRKMDELIENLQSFFKCERKSHEELTFAKSLNIFYDLLIKALLWTPFSTNDKTPSTGQSRVCQAIQHNFERQVIESQLPSGCILEGILRLQKIDKIRNVEEIYKLYQSEAVKCSEIDDYLIASVANDCSIMIAFDLETTTTMTSSDSEKDCIYLKTENSNKYRCSVSAIDLDKKTVKKIPGHYQEFLKCCSLYEKVIETLKK